jgi:lantibiotic modifying enzyme
MTRREFGCSTTVERMERCIKHNFDVQLSHETTVDACLTPTFVQRLQRAIAEAAVEIVNNAPPNPRHGPSDIYVGDAGIALMFFHLKTKVQIPGITVDLATAYCSSALAKVQPSKHYSFLMSEVGVHCVVSVVLAANGKGKEARAHARQVIEVGQLIARTRAPEMELLYGLTGYLYAILFLDSKLSFGLDEKLVKSLIHRIMEAGRAGGKERVLFWKWHDKEYLGAAHGAAGILTLLLRVSKHMTQKELSEVKDTIDYLITLKTESGNYPSSLESNRDELVQWCHGATGFVLLFCSAHQYLKDQKYLEAAVKAGQVVWQRGVLKKGVGLCHGISGNSYAFLALYHSTKNPAYFQRALMFAEYALEWKTLTSNGTFATPDRPFSLFEGLGGLVMLWNDLLTNQHGFPCMTDV